MSNLLLNCIVFRGNQVRSTGEKLKKRCEHPPAHSFFRVLTRVVPQLPRCQTEDASGINAKGGQPFPSKIYLLVMDHFAQFGAFGAAWYESNKFNAWAGS